MNTLITFEIAELLKEKGWNTNTYSNCWVKTLDGDIIHNKDRKSCPEHDRSEQYLMQPKIVDVVMWLWETHKIWISMDRGVENEFWGYVRNSSNKPEVIIMNSSELKTPAAAYTEGILYALNNLI
jgi:hypothetical protein